MKKLFPFVLLAIALTGFGCVKPVVPPTSTPVESQAVVPLPATPFIPSGFATFVVHDHLHSISYPTQTPALAYGKDPIQLPVTVGNKSRTMAAAFYPIDTKVDDKGCVIDPQQTPSLETIETFNTFPFCVAVTSEGAAGSIYQTYTYTIGDGVEFNVFSFVVRYPTSVREYAGCETDADLSKQVCKDLAFDEARDTQLFKDIMATFRNSRSESSNE